MDRKITTSIASLISQVLSMDIGQSLKRELPQPQMKGELWILEILTQPALRDSTGLSHHLGLTHSTM